MKQRVKDIVTGALVSALVLGTVAPTFAKVSKMNIPVSFNNIKVVVDGNQLKTDKEPFIYDGTTYLPVRAVGEAVDKEVGWDSATQTVTLNSKIEESPEELPIVEESVEDKKSQAEEDGKKEEVYGIRKAVDIMQNGEVVGKLTINRVRKTDERNQFHKHEPADVVIINYTYENTGLDDEDGMYITDSNFTVIDESKNMCDTYPVTVSRYPIKTPVGAKCTVEEAYGVESDSDELTIIYSSNLFSMEDTVTFKVPIR